MIACRRAVVSTAFVTAFLCGMAVEALAQRCQPRRALPRIELTTLGPCQFNPETFSFAGDAEQQAKCLMRSATARRNLGPMLDSLPPALASRIGQPSGLPDREALAAHLAALGLAWDYAPFLWQPLSRARDNDPDAPQARYFVIHDTSGPNFGRRPFPVNIDEHRGINNLSRHRCDDGWESAHVIINRAGAMLLGHEFGEPWRATRFERATRFGTGLKGLFLHVELVQPRRSRPGRGRGNDALAPTPGFSDIQYERLALIYTIASVRAGSWLIPAFHIAIDAGIRGGHDDPQNFEIPAFAASIERLAKRLDHVIEPPTATIEAPLVEEPVEEIVVAGEQPEPLAEPTPITQVAEVQSSGSEVSQEGAAPRDVAEIQANSVPLAETHAYHESLEPSSGLPAADRIGAGDTPRTAASSIAILNFVPGMFLLIILGCAILATRGRGKHGPAGRDGRV